MRQKGTHGYRRPVIACFYYLEFALELLKGSDKINAYNKTAGNVWNFLNAKSIPKNEMDLLAPLLMADISKLPEEAICSLHYVADTLKASIWCFMNTDNYKDAVLKAVNLGHDTDTTAAVTGELAGLYYGFESIPEKWINEIRRSNDINDLCNRFTKAMGY